MAFFLSLSTKLVTELSERRCVKIPRRVSCPDSVRNKFWHIAHGCSDARATSLIEKRQFWGIQKLLEAVIVCANED